MKTITFLTKQNLLKTFLLTVYLILIWNVYTFSQTLQIVSISPSFNEISENENPEISVEFNIHVEPASINNITFSVKGERSAYHTGQINFTNENKTVSFISENIFNAGERVFVNLSKNILSATGDSLKGYNWTFRIPVKPNLLNFSEPLFYEGGGHGMQCVDMNNDGYPDILTSSGVIFINDGNGEFSTYWNLDDADPYFFPIIVDDFNKDGYMDVFYAGTGGLTVGFGNGSGNFVKSYYPWWFDDYISTDINSDGYPDIVGIDVLPVDTISYWAVALNNGTGQFNDTIIAGELTGEFRKIISDDVDNDGDKDILIISTTTGFPPIGLEGIVVFRNNGDYIFDDVQLYPACNEFNIMFPNYLYTSDFNNDGLTDIAVIADMGGGITFNKGDGIFGECFDTTNTRIFWGPEQRATFTGGDFDGDNWIDLAVSGFSIPFEPESPKEYAVLKNCNSYFLNCNFLFDTLGNYETLIHSNASADLNGNGFLDIVHSGYGLYITLAQDITPSVQGISETPEKFILYQNYPNPFNSQTEIGFKLYKAGTVQVSIFNLLGEEVNLLEKKESLPGYHKILWDGKDNNDEDLPSGVYIIRANIAGYYKTIKSLFLK